MKNLNNTDKTSENAEKELRISDVISSSNFTREEASIYLQEKLLDYHLHCNILYLKLFIE
jgi:hypothetical protein